MCLNQCALSHPIVPGFTHFSHIQCILFHVCEILAAVSVYGSHLIWVESRAMMSLPCAGSGKDSVCHTVDGDLSGRREARVLKRRGGTEGKGDND